MFYGESGRCRLRGVERPSTDHPRYPIECSVPSRDCFCPTANKGSARMYSRDVRNRMSSYDRMRADQVKITGLTTKARQMKERIKNGKGDDYQHMSPKKGSSPGRSRSSSPLRLQQTFDLVDARSFK
jgi:hypothetical protein